MKLSKLKKYRKRHRLFKSLGTGSPTLLLGVDLPFVVATAFTLKNAAAISIQMLMIHMVTMLVARTLTIRLRLGPRTMVNVCVSFVMMLLSRELVMLLFPGILNSVGMYLYLMAVNGLTLLQANSKRGPRRLGETAFRALADVLAFAGIMFAVSLVREVFGNATFWGMPLPLPVKLDGMLIPFFGFIFTGFLLAGLRAANKAWDGLRLSGAALRDAPYLTMAEGEAPPSSAGMAKPSEGSDFLSDFPARPARASSRAAEKKRKRKKSK